MNNANQIWNSLDELAKSVQETYSVTGKQAIKEQYFNQIQQYPLYFSWYDKIKDELDKSIASINVLEYGSGLGLLAEMLVNHPKVKSYTAVEPEQIFCEMTAEKIGSKGKIIKDCAESYTDKHSQDIIIGMASYHHFYDKPKALQNIYANLKKDGQLIIADVFLPNYLFDSEYNPINKTEFTSSVLKYATAQILSMPNPQSADVIDQIKTAILDISRIEELKVCFPICLKQLRNAGFKDIISEHMHGADHKIDYDSLGYYFINAKRS
jgi:SAM-dependent methyltransferase